MAGGARREDGAPSDRSDGVGFATVCGMDDERTPADGSTLPKYVRFARSLALVSGAAVGLGIAVGSTVFTAAGCDQGCTGICTNGVSVDPDAGSGWHPDRFDSDAGDTGEGGAP